MSLSARIMNLPPMGDPLAFNVKLAAAELAAEADAIRDELVAALEAAEAGLVIAGADRPHPGDFVPTPKLALRQVRAALARAKRQAWPPTNASALRRLGRNRDGLNN